MPEVASENAGDGADVENILSGLATLWYHTLSYIKSMCLKCAVELNIAEAIQRHGRAATISDLQSYLSIPEAKSRRLRTMMRLLSREGIFESHPTLSGEEAFDLSPVSRLLTAPIASPIVLMFLDRHFVDPCHQLSRWFHRPDVAATPFEMAHGKTFWDLAGARPEFNELVNKGMESDSSFFKDVLANFGAGEVFRGIRTLVDVGGGTGLVAAALVEAFPGLKCTVLDLPHVVNTAENTDGIQFVAGDMFADIPPADVALLKWVLHDWSDEDCIRILQRCKEAIAPREKGGKVIIIEMVVGEGIDTQNSLETQLLFDLELMILLPGKERDREEWHNIFVAAGFNDYKITASIGVRSIIEIYP